MDRRSLLAVLFGLTTAFSLWVILSLQSPFAVGEFGIVSSQDNTIVVKDRDIAGYNLTSHELILTVEGAERIRKVQRFLGGPFTIMIGGEEILDGLFVPPIISRSYPSSQVVITYPSFDSNYGVMKIQMGYPWDETVSNDPRNDPRIAQYFDATGRLTR